MPSPAGLSTLVAVRLLFCKVCEAFTKFHLGTRLDRPTRDFAGDQAILVLRSGSSGPLPVFHFLRVLTEGRRRASDR